MLLQERGCAPELPFDLTPYVNRLAGPERDFWDNRFWQFWGRPYIDVFEAFGSALRALKLGRPIPVYDPNGLNLMELVELEDDGGIVALHESYKLHPSTARRRMVRFMKTFLHQFAEHCPSCQLVFLSPLGFFHEWEDINYVKADNGYVRFGWRAPTDLDLSPVANARELTQEAEMKELTQIVHALRHCSMDKACRRAMEANLRTERSQTLRRWLFYSENQRRKKYPNKCPLTFADDATHG